MRTRRGRAEDYASRFQDEIVDFRNAIVTTRSIITLWTHVDGVLKETSRYYFASNSRLTTKPLALIVKNSDSPGHAAVFYYRRNVFFSSWLDWGFSLDTWACWHKMTPLYMSNLLNIFKNQHLEWQFLHSHMLSPSFSYLIVRLSDQYKRIIFHQIDFRNIFIGYIFLYLHEALSILINFWHFRLWNIK